MALPVEGHAIYMSADKEKDEESSTASSATISSSSPLPPHNYAHELYRISIGWSSSSNELHGATESHLFWTDGHNKFCFATHFIFSRSQLLPTLLENDS